MTPNDKKVKQLWDIVNLKKVEIKEAERPNWKTNCTFSYAGDTSTPHQRFNIQTVTDINEFVDALAFLNARKEFSERASLELGLPEYSFKWQGYSRDAWKADFATRINKIRINDKKKELASLEMRLQALLSPELRAELELADIEKSLGI
jgi:hypothetical protein